MSECAHLRVDDDGAAAAKTSAKVPIASATATSLRSARRSVLHARVDLVADRPNRFDALARGSSSSQVLVLLVPGIDRAGVAAAHRDDDIAAARTTSSVTASRRPRSCRRRPPASPRSGGVDLVRRKQPAERRRLDPRIEASGGRRHLAAPPLSTQTNGPLGYSLRSIPRLREREPRSRAKRCARTGRRDVDLRLGEPVDRTQQCSARSSRAEECGKLPPGALLPRARHAGG